MRMIDILIMITTVGVRIRIRIRIRTGVRRNGDMRRRNKGMKSYLEELSLCATGST